MDWEKNVFEPRTIVFSDVLNYRVEEGPFAGAPTVLAAHDNGRQGLYFSVTRSLLFKSVELRTTASGRYIR